MGVLDSGHVYTSLWRTYFYSIEFWRRPVFYTLVPLSVFLFFWLWIFFGKAFLLGNFVLYAALHHNFKQFLGISKWYQRINVTYSREANYFFLLLCFISLTGLHFREGARLDFLNLELITLFPNAAILFYVRLLYWLVFFFWLIHEFYSFLKQGKKMAMRFFSIGVPSLLYGLCFLYGQGIEQVLFPLVAAHGVAYIALITRSAKALKMKRIWKNALLWVLATAVFFGLMVFMFSPNRSDLRIATPLQAFLGALFLTPLFCHYIFDSYLWLSTHPDSAKIAKGVS